MLPHFTDVLYSLVDSVLHVFQGGLHDNVGEREDEVSLKASGRVGTFAGVSHCGTRTVWVGRGA